MSKSQIGAVLRPVASWIAVALVVTGAVNLSFWLGWGAFGANWILLVALSGAEGVYIALVQNGIIAPDLQARWFGFG